MPVGRLSIFGSNHHPEFVKPINCDGFRNPFFFVGTIVTIPSISRLVRLRDGGVKKLKSTAGYLDD